MLSPILYSLYTWDCSPTHPANTIIKFADDTTVVGLISNQDETTYRDEVRRLTGWCGENSLSLNMKKTKELMLDFRRNKNKHLPLRFGDQEVKQMSSFKFLGTHISNDLKWSVNTTAAVKKAHQRLYFLRTLRNSNMSPCLLKTFYHCSVESVLTYSILAWFGTAQKQTGRLSTG